LCDCDQDIDTASLIVCSNMADAGCDVTRKCAAMAGVSPDDKSVAALLPALS
jgi:hypothetical protein